MAGLPELTEKSIRTHVGEHNVQKARPYARGGSVFEGRRQGRTLKALCQGTAPQPYRVEVTCEATGIRRAHCSCPVGSGGICKHVAALLLAWRKRPETFREVEELDTALERRSKAELVALVKQMLRRQPELEALLETPLPGADERRSPVGPDAFHRQAAAAFRHGGGEWGASGVIAGELQAIAEIGVGFARQKDFDSASAVYEGILAAVVEEYEQAGDEEGEIAAAAGACAQQMGRVLAHLKEAPRRAAVLRVLFALYRLDVESGGTGLGDEVPGLILQHATEAERRLVAGWVKGALPAAEGWRDGFERQVLGGFLLET